MMSILEAPAAHTAPDMLAAALDWVTRGFPIQPLHTPDATGRCDCWQGAACPHAGKHPHARREDDGSYRAIPPMDSADAVRAWWGWQPDSNVGIALEPAGLVVVAPDSVHWRDEFRRR